MKTSVPYMQIRGGSSKGIYFNQEDLPQDSAQRDQVILDIVGRDARQIDGLGGANPLTSKVAIISPSVNSKADIDYLFVQVVVGENRVDTSPNCGNILAGVGAFAIEAKMVEVIDDVTRIKVNMINSDNICELVLQTPNKKLTYAGDAKIDGVSGTSAPIICNYMDIEGSICGSLFPSGKEVDLINDVSVTCIDNGMPVILIKATELGKSGYESCEELSEDANFKRKIEDIRLKAGVLMGLGDVTNKVIPKVSIVSKAVKGGDICTRTFIPRTCHSSIGVLGAVSVASACLFEGTVAYDLCNLKQVLIQNISVEHPSGEFMVGLESEYKDNKLSIKKAGLLRTARLLSKGEAFLSDNVIKILN